MPTTTEELTYARSWIGNTETNAVFNERFDRLLPDYDSREEAITAAIEESLRAQLAALTLDQPSSMSLPGGISASYGENIRALRELLDKAQDSPGGSGQGQISQLYRPDAR